MDKDQMPYSYHTFMYPFYWTDEIHEIHINAKWQRVRFQNTVHAGSDDDLLRYATYQYFSPKAGRLIFDEENNAIECCRLSDVNTENSFLDMWLDGSENSSICHRLRVNQVRLELLRNLKIGVLILEAENYGEVAGHDILAGCSQEERLQEITKMNDLGRRVFSPYLMKKDGRVQKGGEAPWKVTLKTPAEDYALVDCTDIGDKVHKGKLEVKQSPVGFEELILSSEENHFHIFPAIDDRMFVTCCLGVKDFAAFEPMEDGGFGYQNKSDLCYRNSAELLYKMLFLERGHPNCQNHDMLVRKLEEHLDPRWIQWGTIHGVTEYSMLCLTGCDASGKLDGDLRAAVINPFLTEYVEMAKIAVLQRAAMIQLEDEASRVSREIGTGNDIQHIQNLWKTYLLFQSELLLPEVTFQEQGVEIYDILKESLRISELSASLNTNMYNLHEMAEFEDAEIRRKIDKENGESDARLGRAVNLFSVVGISLALAGLVQDAIAYTGLGPDDNHHPITVVLCVAVLSAELFLLYKWNLKWLERINNDNDDPKLYYDINREIWKRTILVILASIVLQTLFLLLVWWQSLILLAVIVILFRLFGKGNIS